MLDCVSFKSIIVENKTLSPVVPVETLTALRYTVLKRKLGA